MYCRFCGHRIPDNSNVCPSCSNRTEVFPPNAYQLSDQPADNINTRAYTTDARVPVQMYIILAVTAVLFVIFLILTILSFVSPPENKDDSTQQAPVLSLTHEYISTQTDRETILITGTISASDTSSNLTLNGELIDSVSAGESGKVWSKTIPLTPGQNSFILTLSDNTGNSRSESFSVERLVPIVYQPGTVFVKLDKAAIYIRPTPQISDKYVIKLASNDYTTQLVCVGVEHTDPDGNLWCKVRTPSNGIGWVRTDLIKAI